MIDDEKLQQLLSKASSLYNGGEYKGAIAAWQEALTVDPSSRKAQEGIRMATLLMGDWEPAGSPAAAEEPEAAADGDDGGAAALSPEELEAKLDLGIARVKQLLAQRKYSEAVDGARGLVPIDPDSEEVQRLLEDAQQAFEAAPFIEEHLTLARELMEQERYPEAETECKKVFTLDADHPAAHSLLATIRAKIQSNLKKAADQIGGMTVKLTVPEVLAAAKAPAKGSPPPSGPPAGRSTGPVRDDSGDFDLDGADAPAIPLAPSRSAGDGEAAATQEEVSARNALDAAFEQAGVDDLPVGESTPDPAVGDPGGTLEAGPAAPESEQAEVVEAQTVVKPSVRVVPRVPASPDPGQPAARPAPSAPASSAGAEPKPPATPAKPAAKAAVKAQAAKPAFDETAWETELAQLNIKQEERDMLKGTPAKVSSAPVDPQADADLMSFLDNDLGGMPEPPGQGGSQEAPAAPALPSIPLKKETKPAGEPAKPKREAVSAETAVPHAAPHARSASRAVAPPLPGPKSRSSLPKLFALLGLLLLAGAAATWWFLFQPKSAGGTGGPSQPAAPPSSSAPGAVAAGGEGTIPTPIGSTSRQAAPAAPEAAPAGAAPASVASPAAASPAAPAVSGEGAPPAAPAEPPKPAAPALSPEEAHRKIVESLAAGRQLIQAGKWREAHAKLGVVLAIDPANFEAKDLSDRAQSHIEADQHIYDDFESAKKFFADKDYENALRKFYRLPRDKDLGDIDVSIRNSWFNWAVMSMRGGNATDALQKLKELLDVDPDDAEALKIQEVAEHYVSRAKDRVFYAFTDTLKLRAFDQK